MNENERGLPPVGEDSIGEEENFEREPDEKRNEDGEREPDGELGDGEVRDGGCAECGDLGGGTGEEDAARASDDAPCDRGIPCGTENDRGEADARCDPSETVGASYDPAGASARRETEEGDASAPDRLTGEENARKAAYEELREFFTLYPEVSFREIPTEVRESALPLSAAYALYERRALLLSREAERENEINRSRSAGSVSAEGDAVYTREEIRRMTSEEVRRNYDAVMRSLSLT